MCVRAFVHVRVCVRVRLVRVNTHYGLQLGSRQHELHLLSQHGRRRLLLDQVVPAVDLQLGLQVGGGVQVLAVLARASTLWRETERERERGAWR